MSPGLTKHISYPKGGLEMMDLLNKIKLLGQNFLPSRTSPKLLKVLTERLLSSSRSLLQKFKEAFFEVTSTPLRRQTKLD